MIRRGLARHFYYRPEITVRTANANLEISRGTLERARCQINNSTWKAMRRVNIYFRAHAYARIRVRVSHYPFYYELLGL